MTPQSRSIGLIDCLVILASVAVVAGIAASGLQNTQAHRLRIMELSRLRDLAAALHTYSVEDSTNVLGPVHPNSPGFLGEGYADFGGGPGTSTFLNWGEQLDPSQRPLNRLLYGYTGDPVPTSRQTAPGDRSVYKEFQCLGNDLGWQSPDLFLPGEIGVPYFKSNGTAFRLNNLQQNNFFGIGIYARPTNRIPVASETVVLMESRAFETMLTSPNSVFFFGNALDLTGYHGKLAHFMLTYADGHASFEDMSGDTYVPAGGPDLRIRGTWGRMDCSEDPILID